MISQPTGGLSSKRFVTVAIVNSLAAMLLMAVPSTGLAQDVRWSWFEVSFVQQDIDEQGTMTDFALNQSVNVDAKDGDGIKFRASVGTWHNLFAFLDFNSSDIDVDALVTNSGGVFPASDEFDYTYIRGGVGVKFAVTHKTDLYGAVSYDSADYDFGSFAGENFDTGEKGLGGEVGFRSMISDKFEIRARARYTEVGVVDLSTGVLDTDTLLGVGFGYEVIRGLSIIGDYEEGDHSSWNIGFRMDLNED